MQQAKCITMTHPNRAIVTYARIKTTYQHRKISENAVKPKRKGKEHSNKKAVGLMICSCMTPYSLTIILIIYREGRISHYISSYWS